MIVMKQLEINLFLIGFENKASKESGPGYVVAHKVAMKSCSRKSEKPGPKILVPMFKK